MLPVAVAHKADFPWGGYLPQEQKGCLLANFKPAAGVTIRKMVGSIPYVQMPIGPMILDYIIWQET